MRLYTIGFTQKHAETFFQLLRQNGIQRLVDIRLKPDGQLSAFAKKDDLPYFLAHLADNCHYVHMVELAPSKEILDEYRNEKNWEKYALRFEALMDERKIPETLASREFVNKISCLLCSEATPDHCHRRLVAERLAKHWSNIEIFHL